MIVDQNDLTAFDAITRAKIEVDNRTVRDKSITALMQVYGAIER
jgi:mannose/fructose/N-acetylgalactosamine-specific phosphotransferase system component IIB